MNLTDFRDRLDILDKELLRLFAERMDIVAEVAEYKRQEGLPIYDPQRERQKLALLSEQVPDALRGYAERLFSLLFEVSRAHQRGLATGTTPLQDRIAHAIQHTPPLFPERPLVACQGVEGANSQAAAEKMFVQPNIMHFNSFEGVFRAIQQGLCRYGVLPLENSTAGSVNRVYDLMMQYNFSIVRSTRVKIDHCLLARPGAELAGIREVISHEQALMQCEGFLRGLKNVKITACENTAAAAKMVFESGRNDIAALSSRSCAELYDLRILQASVQDSASNFTRFICIGKELEIYPGADKTSVMLVLPHRPGSLYQALGRLYALGVNLIKLESRPLPGSDFEFMFYFDLEGSVYADGFLRLFSDIEGFSADFRYLGSYSEVV
jgi:chorismate mutase/prephenate dehydratase